MCDNNKKITHNSFIDVDMVSQAENMLIIGNMCGFFGEFSVTSDSAHPVTVDFMNTNPAVISRLSLISDILKAGKSVTVVTNQETKEYYEMLFTFIRKEIFKFNKKNVNFKCINNDKEYIDFLDKMISNNMKFDYIVQNPPYSGSLHLDFLSKGLDLLEESGKMVIIEPATWLINVKDSVQAKKGNEIKDKYGKHIYKVVIENLNKEFDTHLFVPFSITYIDLGTVFSEIDFWCCGEHKVVNNIYDCNMIGDYNTIQSILTKCRSYGDMMNDHIYKEGKTQINDETYFAAYCELIGRSGVSDPRFGDVWFINNYYTNCYYPYINFNEEITNIPIFSLKSGYTYDNPKYSDKLASQLYGTKQELENWKYFIFNTKLPVFIACTLMIHQTNTVKTYIPWLVDKQYTDSEIYQLLGITEDEQKFIDKTIKKYERHSPWFKRYMCGKDSVSNEEVQKFIDSL